MWRSLFIVSGAAALGSLVGTVGLALLSGDTGVVEQVRFVFGFATVTMMFTLPGTIMLIGLQAILTERELGTHYRNMITILFGVLAGAIVLTFISIYLADVGAFYGLCTGIALLCLQRLVPNKSHAAKVSAR